jgi:hypothetical protein
MAMELASQKTGGILDTLPVLSDTRDSVLDAIRRLENPTFADDVTGISVARRAPKTGFFDPTALPAITFKTPAGTHKTVVVFGPASYFDAFGPFLNEARPNGKKAFQLIETSDPKCTRIHDEGSTGQDMDMRANSHLPFDFGVETETTKISFRCSFRAALPGPANQMEVWLWHACEEFANKNPGVLYPPTAYKLPPVDVLLADAGAKGYMKKPTKEATVVNKGETRVCNNNNFLVNVPFVKKMHGIKVDSSTENVVDLKKQLREQYPDVVEKLFTSFDGLPSSAGGLMSLLASAPAIRELMAVNLDVTRLADLFKSIGDKAAYKYAIPEIYGPDNTILTARDLFDLTYKRDKSLTPFLVTEFQYSIYRAENQPIVSVVGAYPRTTIVGLVPAIPIKVMSTAKDSCISIEMATRAVDAVFAKRAGQPALPAPEPIMAIEAADDAGLVEAAEAAELQDESRKRPNDEKGGEQRKNKRQKCA